MLNRAKTEPKASEAFGDRVKIETPESFLQEHFKDDITNRKVKVYEIAADGKQRRFLIMQWDGRHEEVTPTIVELSAGMPREDAELAVKNSAEIRPVL